MGILHGEVRRFKSDKINAAQQLAEAAYLYLDVIFPPLLNTNLANEKPILVTEQLELGNNKTALYLNVVVTPV